jgi:hypothetical protein
LYIFVCNMIFTQIQSFWLILHYLVFIVILLHWCFHHSRNTTFICYPLNIIHSSIVLQYVPCALQVLVSLMCIRYAIHLDWGWRYTCHKPLLTCPCQWVNIFLEPQILASGWIILWQTFFVLSASKFIHTFFRLLLLQCLLNRHFCFFFKYSASVL